ncbi:MAG: flagellin [Planctomycetota bacterium]
MTRINTNVSSLVAQNRLQSSNESLNTALTRLSTGLRINTGSDDPAGLIASEALRSEITSLGKAISNTERASQIISTADSALGEVSNLLNDIRGLVIQASNTSGLSDEEIAANQLQIDSSLEAINRISQSTTFQGRKLLDGSLDFQTDASQVSSLTDLNIDQASLGSLGSVQVDVDIQSAATKASVSTTGIAAGATAAQSSGEVSLSGTVADAQATKQINFANSFSPTQAVSTISFDNAYTSGNEGNADVILGQNGSTTNVEINIAAVNGGAFDGTDFNSATLTINEVSNGTASTASVSGSAVTINIEQGETITNILQDLNDSGLGDDLTFGLASGTAGTEVYDNDTNSETDGNAFSTFAGYSAGTAESVANFRLNAVAGGAADGATGDATTISITTGTSTAAAYDTDSNAINITVADGATIQDVVNAINNDISSTFTATNVSNGNLTYDGADTFGGAIGTTATSTSGDITEVIAGADAAQASSFVVDALKGGAADGTAGNGIALAFTVDTDAASTTASYDSAGGTIDIVVADGATTQDVATAINSLADFVVKNVVSGDAFVNPDLTTGSDLNPTTASDLELAGGTDTTASDVITVNASSFGSAADGATISLVGDNSLAAGTASATADTNGNITVSVSSAGDVTSATIAAAINDLSGYEASVTSDAGPNNFTFANGSSNAFATTTALSGGAEGGGLADDLVVQLTGSVGSEVFQFQAGSTIDAVIQSINLVQDSTGIEAINEGGALKLQSIGFGSNAAVDVEVISEGAAGNFESGLSAQRATGTDIVATINGITANSTGNTLSVNTSTLDLSLSVADGSSTDFSFNITGGGAQFQLGADVVSTQQARLGIGSVASGNLGGAAGRLYELGSGQSAALGTDAAKAGDIINEVIGKVTGLRGRLGAFQATTLESNLTSLGETRANLLEAESSIRDADFAQESANLTRSQILVQSGTNVLALANQNPQNVLALLG